MARYTNIVSFEDAQAASRRRRIQEAVQDQHLSSLKNGPIHYDLSLFAAPSSRDEGHEDEQAAEAARSQRGGRHGTMLQLAPRNARPSADEAFDDEFDYAYEEPAPRTASLRGDIRDQRQRQRAKARASRMYDDQFGEADALPEAEDGAPRAALYEGRLGSSQKRAARMQRASEAASPFVKIDPAGWFSRIGLSVGRMRAITAVLCVVLTVAFLYTPAQHYYQSVREHDRLAAEYASIQERNSTLISQNESLASNAGMEDAVRQKYGYVVGGEETAIVTGLSDEATDSHGDGVEANVLSSSIKAPEEWYTPILDALFGVS